MADESKTIDWGKVSPTGTPDPTDLVNSKFGTYKDPVDGVSIDDRLGAVGPMAPAPAPLKGMK